MVKIQDLMKKELVLIDLKASSKEEVFLRMVCRLADEGCVEGGCGEDLCRHLGAREEVGSTALGHGVAIPHAYFSELDRTMVVYARLSPPLDFDAPDGRRVDKVFMLVGPKRRPTEHLMILARISHLIRDTDFLARLENALSGQEVMDAVRAVESRH